MAGDSIASLIELAASYGISITRAQTEKLLHHLELVVQVNKHTNLTRITTLDEALVLHVLDSLLALHVMAEDFDLSDGSTSFLDMGTGAGFPGVPIAICTAWKGLLVDSVRKKTDAVQSFSDALSLERSATAHGRLEDLALEHSKTFDVVVARAVASAPVLVEYAAPFLKLGGCLYVMKARPSADELDQGNRAADLCGMRNVGCRIFDLPNEMGHREILVYKKVSSPSIRLPRAVGKARKEPLG